MGPLGRTDLAADQPRKIQTHGKFNPLRGLFFSFSLVNGILAVLIHSHSFPQVSVVTLALHAHEVSLCRWEGPRQSGRPSANDSSARAKAKTIAAGAGRMAR